MEKFQSGEQKELERYIANLKKAVQEVPKAMLGVAQLLKQHPEIIAQGQITDLNELLNDLKTAQERLTEAMVLVSEEYRNKLPLVEYLRHLINTRLNIDISAVSAEEWKKNKEKVASLIKKEFGDWIAGLFGAEGPYGVEEIDIMAFFNLPPRFTLDEAIEVLSQFKKISEGYVLRRASLEPFLRAGLIIYIGRQGEEHLFRQITVGELERFIEGVQVGELVLPRLSLSTLKIRGKGPTRAVNALRRNRFSTIGVVQFPLKAFGEIGGIGKESKEKVIPEIKRKAEEVVDNLGLNDIKKIPIEVLNSLRSY